jgi:hypothetical protein
VSGRRGLRVLFRCCSRSEMLSVFATTVEGCSELRFLTGFQSVYGTIFCRYAGQRWISNDMQYYSLSSMNSALFNAFGAPPNSSAVAGFLRSPTTTFPLRLRFRSPSDLASASFNAA